MTDALAARLQMAFSLGFHIIFAEISVALPVMGVIAEWRWLRTGDAVYLDLAKRWAKGTAILFAVGAVSGTALSFELGLLWPRFMELAGPLIESKPRFSMRDRLAAEEMKEDHELPATVQHSDGVLNRGGRRSRRVRMLTHRCVPHFPVRSCGFIRPSM